MIINSKDDLNYLSDQERETFKSRLSKSIYGWDWSEGEWVQTVNTATIEQFGFTISDFPDAPKPDMPAFNPDEQETERQNKEAEENRQSAYRDESDPLFFKWQRGESTEQDWLDKVQEIKDRFPKS